jgi:hypothetical protein
LCIGKRKKHQNPEQIIGIKNCNFDDLAKPLLDHRKQLCNIRIQVGTHKILGDEKTDLGRKAE